MLLNMVEEIQSQLGPWNNVTKLEVWQSFTAAKNAKEREQLSSLGVGVKTDYRGYPELERDDLLVGVVLSAPVVYFGFVGETVHELRQGLSSRFDVSL